ncbi:MAG: MFS transporter [Rhodoferax sp.]|nr:MFS transporter [Rhodoferax sp.]
MKSRALARLIACQICIHGCMAGMRLAAPLLALRDGYSALAVGALLALFSLAQVFLALPAGRFSDRRGLRRPVGLAVVVSCAGAACAVAFPVYPVLCLTALLTGGATGAASIALQRHVGRAAQGATELKRVFSWLATGPAISNFFGPFSAGLLIDYAGQAPGDTTGYRAAFLFMALLPLLSWYWIRQVTELAPVAKVHGALPTRAWDLMRDPMMRRLMIVNWCMSSCWDVHTFVVPVIGHERGFSASVIGTILGAFAIAAALVRVVMPIFAAHLREHAVVATAMIVTAMAFAVYPLMRAPLAMGVCSVVLGVALGSVQPMIMSTLHQITPEARHGEALGLRLMAINASSVLMPILFGTVGAVVGVSVVFWVVGSVVGASARVAWQLRAAPESGH